jgi:hypothetical protein
MYDELTFQTKKIDIIQWLATVEDEAVLDKVADLIKKERENDWWINASDSEKLSLEKGISDAENGKLHPHSKATDIYGKWL